MRGVSTRHILEGTNNACTLFPQIGENLEAEGPHSIRTLFALEGGNLEASYSQRWEEPRPGGFPVFPQKPRGGVPSILRKNLEGKVRS